MPKIYVASSWRNPYYEQVVKRLREQGYEVYDFRNPPHGGNGFHWTDIDENAPNWTFEQYAEGLNHPLAGQVERGGFIEACGAGIGPGVAPRGVGAPAGGIVPAVATAGGIGVDGDEDDVAGAEDLADGVNATAAFGEGDVLLFRHEEHMDPFIEKIRMNKSNHRFRLNSFLIF